MKENEESYLLISIASRTCMEYLKKNIILTGKLNPDKKILWIVGVNEKNQKIYDSTFGKKTSYNNVKIERLVIREPSNYLYKILPSYEHGRALDWVLKKWDGIQKYKFAFVLDPDFYMVRNNWMEEIQNFHMKIYPNYAAVGTSWDPSILKDTLGTPAPHFLSINLQLCFGLSFEPKLKKRKLISQLDLKNSFKLNLFLNQNLETGRQFRRRSFKFFIMKGVLVVYLFKINKLSDVGDWQNKELLKAYLKYRRSSGVIFEHVWNSKMLESLRDLTQMSANEYFPNIALRKLSFIYSFKSSKSTWIRQAYKSDHQYLLFNKRLYALHIRKNLNKVNFSKADVELKKVLDLVRNDKLM